MKKVTPERPEKNHFAHKYLCVIHRHSRFCCYHILYCRKVDIVAQKQRTDKNGTTTAKIQNGSGTPVDLSDYVKKTEVAQAIESAHTHTNKEFLDGIEAYLNSTYSKVTAERESADNNLAKRITALEDSVGDISTALAMMVEV
mgnify:CR=1 FL=1